MRRQATTWIMVLLVALPGLAAAQAELAANAGADKTLETGESTTFDGTASTGSIASYNWDFGDGTTGVGATLDKTYSSAGTYTVTLLVVGTSGSVDTDTATVVVRSSDTTAPNITHTAVTSGTSNSAISVSATVTDNIGVQSVTVHYKRATDASYNSSTLTCTGSATSKTCNGTIPASVTDGSGVSYYIRAQDTKTPTANTNTYPAAAPTSALSVSLTDTAAPTLTSTAPSGATAGTNLTVTATLADAVGVSGATLYYRFTTAGSFSNVTMSRTSGSSTNGTYTASIAVSSSATELQYYLSASDASGNAATLPASAPGTLTSIGVTSASAPSITHTATASATAGQDVSITATVSAGTGRAIANVTLRYRAAGETEFTSLLMTNSTGASVYAATIPGAAVTDEGVEYFIRANDTAGDSARSPSAGSTAPNLAVTPPAAASGLTATRASGGVSLSWSAAASSATSSVGTYNVYRSTSSSSGFAVLASVDAAETSYLDTAAVEGIAYSYKVSAVDDFSTEGSLTSAATSGRGALPEAPVVTLTPLASGTLRASWDAVDGAGWYIVESSADGTTWSTAQNVTASPASVSGLTDGVASYVRVRPYNAFDEEGASSDAESATPIAAPTGTPSVTATATSSGVTVSWSALAGTSAAPVAGYAVQRSTSTDDNFTDLASTTATSYSDASVVSGTVYYYRVAATNAVGAGSYSSAAQATATTTGSGGSTGGSSSGGSGGSGSTGGDTGASDDETPSLPTPEVVEEVDATPVASDGDADAAYEAAAGVADETDELKVAIADEASPLREVRLVVEGAGSLSLRVETYSAAPADAPGPAPSGFRATTVYFTAEATPTGGAVTTGAAELTFRIPRAALGGLDPARGVLLHGKDGAWEILPTTLVDGASDPVVYKAVAGSFSPFAFALDEEAPVIDGLRPVADGATTDTTPILGANWADARGLDLDSAVVTLDGEPLAIAVGADGFLHRLEAPLALGAHTVRVSIRDTSGLEGSAEWTFQVVQTLAPGEPGEASETPGTGTQTPGAGSGSGGAGSGGEGADADAGLPAIVWIVGGLAVIGGVAAFVALRRK